MAHTFPEFDLYEELGVEPTASTEDIRAAYLSLARVFHPDTGSVPSTARMSRLNQAFAVLSDPTSRSEYDAVQDRPRWFETSPPTPDSSIPAPGSRPSMMARIWGRAGGWVITLLIFGGIGLIRTLAAEEDQRSSIEAQNRAAQGAVRSTASADSDTGQTNVFDLRRGDCITDTGDAPMQSVTKVACSSPRATQRVTSLFTVTPTGTAYPAVSYFDRESRARCPADTVWFHYPTSESWAAGDRTITCLASPR